MGVVADRAEPVEHRQPERRERVPVGAAADRGLRERLEPECGGEPWARSKRAAEA